MIAERQKLIRIAERSELGWSVVAEYNADELADDSKDEKRLEKAELSSERKVAKQKIKRVEPAAVKRGSFVGHAHGLPGPEATRNDSL